MAKVFVYGSLKRGFYNHGVLERSNPKFIDNFVTSSEYTMYSLGGYPAVKKGGDLPIFGEIYEVENLDKLDRLEGHPNYYTREVIDTPFGDVWIYLFNMTLPSRAIKMQEGIWEEKVYGTV